MPAFKTGSRFRSRSVSTAESGWLSRWMQSVWPTSATTTAFPWIEDWPTAQQLMDQQLTVDWPALLDGIVQTLNPIHDQIFEAHPTNYYWSTYQSEWAIDI